METRLYVGNLAYSTSEAELRTLFAQAGTVTDVALIKDRDTGQSKGFAFVTLSSQAETEKAISLFNGKEIGGRPLTVNIAKPREERGGGGGGGFGGGNRGGKRGGGGSRRF
ncbi:MAG TPA: RNA-binding protein [Anaerolineales bacterium]|jgi:cold-inducible RNA-binding protein|nr:RNA-binding protein [Anaerolineales bacterium]HRF47867.1 RNA-binding protein [Anaerolineales bacterium]